MRNVLGTAYLISEAWLTKRKQQMKRRKVNATNITALTLFALLRPPVSVSLNLAPGFYMGVPIL